MVPENVPAQALDAVIAQRGGGADDVAAEAEDGSGRGRVVEQLAELLDEWESKVRAFGFERFEGHLDHVKRALGARPPPGRPFAFALWACALVNPLPVLGVAPELRPEVLAARTATEALRAVAIGVRHSIEHVESQVERGVIEQDASEAEDT